MVLRLHLLVSQVFHFAIFFVFFLGTNIVSDKNWMILHILRLRLLLSGQWIWLPFAFFILFKYTKHFIELNKSYITHILLAEWELVVVLIIPKKTATTILGRKCIENKQMSSALHFFKLKKNNVSTKKIAINVLLSNFFYLINLFSSWNAEWEK